MRKYIVVIFVLSFAYILNPYQTKAVTKPCTMVLRPVKTDLINGMGEALIYKVKLMPSFPRTNVSILAVHLPEPERYGNYDGYEGFAFIPDQISWRFKLYPTPEPDPTWAGRFDLITAGMKNVTVQVRLSNSKTEKLGPSILENKIENCK